MATQQAPTRRAVRHERTRAALIDAAWDLAREGGLASVSQRALADRVGLAQPSLYTYFSSKNDLYDALFASGNAELVEYMESLELPSDPAAAVKFAAQRVVEFCVEDDVRYQLLFQRTLPGFVPSEAAYELATRFYELMRRILKRAGVRTQAQMDVFVALCAGLSEAQLANDPGGNRWTRQLDWVVDMFLTEVARQNKAAGRSR